MESECLRARRSLDPVPEPEPKGVARAPELGNAEPNCRLALGEGELLRREYASVSAQGERAVRVTGFGLAFEPQIAAVFRALLTLEGTLRTLDPDFVLVDEVRALAGDVGQKAFGPAALRQAISDDLLKLAPILRNLPKRIDRIAAAMERNQWNVNVRLLADERDARFVTRLADRAIVAFLSAAIGLISAVLIHVGGGAKIAGGLTLPHALGYAGLAVATILGLRVLVAVTRDRIV